MGGNAVLGYYQTFDMEGDSGIVARTFGTCVLLTRQNKEIERGSDSSQEKLHRSKSHRGYSPTSASGENSNDFMSSNSSQERASSPSRTMGNISEAAAAAARHKEGSQDEVQLLTLKTFGPRVRVRIGGLVTARSVKYLGKLASKLSDQETRDGWWSELRDEIRSHARTLCCWHVIGYVEASTIHDDVIVLSVVGTAATVRGLPDITHDYRLWLQWETQQREIAEDGRNRRRRPLSGDRATMSDDEYGVSGEVTPFLDKRSGGRSDFEDGENIDQMSKGEMNSNSLHATLMVTRKALREARRQKHARRLQRRLKRAYGGKNEKSSKGQSKNHQQSCSDFLQKGGKIAGTFQPESGISRISRARPARPWYVYQSYRPSALMTYLNMLDPTTFYFLIPLYNTNLISCFSYQ